MKWNVYQTLVRLDLKIESACNYLMRLCFLTPEAGNQGLLKVDILASSETFLVLIILKLCSPTAQAYSLPNFPSGSEFSLA